MGKRYTKEERREALKLAEEIGAAAAARRLGINVDTLYGWRSREKERSAAVEAAVGGRSEAELVAENEELREQLNQARQDVQILQEALGFSSSAGGRRPRPEAQLHPCPPGPLASGGHVPGAGRQRAGGLPRPPAA